MTKLIGDTKNELINISLILILPVPSFTKPMSGGVRSTIKCVECDLDDRPAIFTAMTVT